MGEELVAKKKKKRRELSYKKRIRAMEERKNKTKGRSIPLNMAKKLRKYVVRCLGKHELMNMHVCMYFSSSKELEFSAETCRDKTEVTRAAMGKAKCKRNKGLDL